MDYPEKTRTIDRLVRQKKRIAAVLAGSAFHLTSIAQDGRGHMAGDELRADESSP